MLGWQPEGSKGALIELRADVERFRSRDKAWRQPGDLATDLIELRKIIDLLELEFSADAFAFAETNQAQHEGSSTPIDWIRHNCKMQGMDAADRVAVGRAAGHLTASIEGTERAEIGFAHLTVMARTYEDLLRNGCAAEFDETALLDRARECSPGRLYRACQHLRHALDERGFAESERLAREQRYLRVTTKDDGTLILSGWLDAAGGAVVRTALDPLARPSGADDERTRENRYANALISLANFALDHCGVPNQASNRPHLAVTTSFETLRGLVGAPAGDLELGAPISSQVVRRTACDSTIRRVLLDPKGLITDVGRARRVVSGAMRRQVEQRDDQCQWPGCTRPRSWCVVHHIEHWIDGGKTKIDNLLLLCHGHHENVHEGGWQIFRGEDGRIHTIRPSPIPYRFPVRAPDTVAA